MRNSPALLALLAIVALATAASAAAPKISIPRLLDPATRLDAIVEYEIARSWKDDPRMQKHVRASAERDHRELEVFQTHHARTGQRLYVAVWQRSDFTAEPTSENDGYPRDRDDRLFPPRTGDLQPRATWGSTFDENGGEVAGGVNAVFTSEGVVLLRKSDERVLVFERRSDDVKQVQVRVLSFDEPFFQARFPNATPVNGRAVKWSFALRKAAIGDAYDIVLGPKVRGEVDAEVVLAWDESKQTWRWPAGVGEAALLARNV